MVTAHLVWWQNIHSTNTKPLLYHYWTELPTPPSLLRQCGGSVKHTASNRPQGSSHQKIAAVARDLPGDRLNLCSALSFLATQTRATPPKPCNPSPTPKITFSVGTVQAGTIYLPGLSFLAHRANLFLSLSLSPFLPNVATPASSLRDGNFTKCHSSTWK